MIDRRTLLATGGLALVGGGMIFAGGSSARPANPLKLSEAEWKKRLTPAQYRILRQEGTERPFSSPLDKEKRRGAFVCAGCGLPLFASTTKFDSGTGWPSFYRPLANAVGTRTDHKIGLPRTEVHCRRCGGHLGHVFKDGPRPTGLRYCMNGDAMAFRPA